MIPYIHPEFVEALQSLVTDRSAKDAPPGVSRKSLARKRKNYFPSLRWSTASLRSLIVAVVSKLILLLIYVCL